MNFPEEIKKLRECALLTQMEFSEIVGVAFSTVNRWKQEKLDLILKPTARKTVFLMKM